MEKRTCENCDINRKLDNEREHVEAIREKLTEEITSLKVEVAKLKVQMLVFIPLVTTLIMSIIKYLFE